MNRTTAILESGYRVAVLCGGTGTEREVSLVSGSSVQSAILNMGIPCDLFDLKTEALPRALNRDRHLVLPIVHGVYGEDGRLSADLESGGFAYAGCGMAASVLCFDKYACKAVAARLEVPVAKDVLLRAGQAPDFESLSTLLGEKIIIKPRMDGSSVGLHLVQTRDAFNKITQELASRDYLAETYMEGYDLTVGVLDGKALGVVAVYPKGGLYDYEHKYTSGMSSYEAPAQIGDDLKSQLQDWSARLFDVCGCRDLARVDFRLGVNKEVVFLEINTLPGMTPTSLLPKSASCEGIDFDSLVLDWVGFALGRKTGRRPL